ncbi:MAG: LysM peptidoglycan-binding domain-containing protein [Gemmatimonadetes bacterium]|nr:MAG: LysM peptidoglycan-binding domain-containing protein [Gemmatimonadota bacterium]
MQKLLIIWLISIISIPVLAEENVVLVTVKEGDTWRKIAEEYLGDADQWEDLVKFNDLKTTQLRVGQKLRIPANSVSRAREQIASAAQSVDKAIENGAQIFAPDALIAAQELLNKAQDAFRKGQYYSARLFAVGAAQKGDYANELSQSMTTKGIEAVIADMRGSVETKKEEDLDWVDAELNQKLFTDEKIRTFERSHADVVFLKGNVLRIDENSLAVIRKLQMDVRKRAAKAQVVLLEGDLSAQLQGLGAQDEVEVVTGTGVTIDSKSKEFQVDVAKEDAATRVVVYDEGGKIDVSSGGETVQLKQFQGTKVMPNTPPEPPRDLLPAPQPVAPESGERIFGKRSLLKWEAVEDAKEYNIQIGKDPLLRNLVINADGLTVLEFETPLLQNGTYYWRVQAVDQDDFPGIYCPAQKFTIFFDETPPALIIYKPQQHQLVLTPEIVLEGKTEPEVVVTINRKYTVQPAADGSFSYPYELNEGENQIEILAVDKLGLENRQTRTVYLDTTPPTIRIPELPETEIATNLKVYPLNGYVDTDATLTINKRPIPTDSNGKFNTTVVLSEGINTIVLTARDRAGQETQLIKRITLDSQPPRLSLRKSTNSNPTNQNIITFSGRVDEAEILMLNGEEIPLTSGMFEKTVRLEEGENELIFVAVDAVGNEFHKTESIFCDTQPPELLSHSVSPSTVYGGETIELRVYARDTGTGLHQTVTYTLKGPDNFQYSGVLTRRSQQEGLYQATVTIPNTVQGRIDFKQIILEDYLGNRQEFTF